MSIETNRLVVEKSLEEIKEMFLELSKLSESHSIHYDDLVEDHKNVLEELTAGDWTRMGVITGLLWYKLDSLISHVKDANGTLKEIERNTSKIK